ncbi:hypothetical protein N0V83_007690 [Neocucurbitaria cava]|uniref:Uncharacterized protein n=1 Tax=Neocucurbitaria cava TaxID=798079 RepID=A0A9W9CJN8_9PLEO|nr:hypothetical protein N0V83_007690 [Neocucurbitaria cava]
MIRIGSATFNITVMGKTYDAQDLNSTTGYCYSGIGYDMWSLYDKSRCLPDTANPSYQWGFSTMVAGIFIFLQCCWTLTMYAVWQDAQFNSILVKSGYEMTILRAAFAMARAAKRKTGLNEKQLVRANKKEVEQEMYGCGKIKAAEVEYGLFVGDLEDGGDDDCEVTRRTVRVKHEPD